MCGPSEGSHTGLDHTDDRHIYAGLEPIEPGGRSGVAGDDHELHVMFSHEEVCDLLRIGTDLLERTRSVGVPTGVAEIDEMLQRQEVDEGSGDGEPPEAAVEHPDRAIIHPARLRRPPRWGDLPGTSPQRFTIGGMADLTLWHNQRCSKSRGACELLTDAGADFDEKRYLDDPPTAADLDKVLTALGMEPWDLARMGETLAKELDLKALPHDRSTWIDVMVANPILIERPILVTQDGRAVVGPPPQNVLTLH